MLKNIAGLMILVAPTLALAADPQGRNTPSPNQVFAQPPIVAGNCAKFITINSIGDAAKTCGGVLVACGTGVTDWSDPCNVPQLMQFIGIR